MTTRRRRVDLDDDQERHESANERSHAHNGWRCDWFSSGKQCWMSGTMSPDVGDKRRKYCHWHYVALTHPTFATDRDEFERWNARWKAYCCTENHHAVVDIWQAIMGLAPLVSTPQPCGNFGCGVKA